MATTAKVTVDEFSKLIQNRRDLYEAVLRNDWYLPKFKTSMITESYLRNVLTGKTFCPKYSDIKLRPCPRPPNKDLLLKKFLKIALDSGWQSIGIDDKHIPDKRWLLDLVSTFTPDDEIFKKNYMPPAKKNKLSEIKAIELPEMFLKDLPNSIRKSKRKGLRLAKDGIAG
jgi:hypothetical protein